MGDALIKLSLSRTNLANEDLRKLKQLQSIEYLDLSRTSVGDEGMAYIAELPKLSYLNLRDTNVSDESIEQLSRLGNLKQVYLWGSEFTQSGAMALQERLPGATIVFGTSLGAGNQRRRPRN